MGFSRTFGRLTLVIFTGAIFVSLGCERPVESHLVLKDITSESGLLPADDKATIESVSVTHLDRDGYLDVVALNNGELSFYQNSEGRPSPY